MYQIYYSNNMKHIKYLFLEMCKRGCIIEARNEYNYATEYIPNCLISFDDDISPFEFRIKSISNDNCLNFSKHGKAKFRYYSCLFLDDRVCKYFCFYPIYTRKEILNYITWFLYTYKTNLFDPDVRLSENIMDKYKKILKNKMTESLIQLYLVKYFYFTSISLPIIEIKMVIVEQLFKLDKWDNLEI